MIDWARWHELLDIEAKRTLTHNESEEMQAFRRVVDALDVEEFERQKEHVEKLIAHHERHIRGINRLTKALENMT